MELLCVLLLVVFMGSLLGWTLAAGYYAKAVRDAFGLGEEIKVLGYLRTKAIKRGIDEEARVK